MFINTEEELEDILSQPNEADKAAMAAMEGDLLILGAGGKMGPSLAHRAKRAAEQAGVRRRIIAVSRYGSPEARRALEAWGVETVSADLLDEEQLKALPDVRNVIYMAARKFGTTGAEHLTWAMNTYLPGRVADRYRNSRIVAFSTGNVYPLTPIAQGGATESTPTAPVGEYGQSALGRERMFAHFSACYGTPVTLLRLNYAVELRYGVLVDTAKKVLENRPVDLAMGCANVIWQGDANSMTIRALAHASSPPTVLNITGPETVSIRWLASEFGKRFGIDPVFEGTEAQTALLSNAGHAIRLFGYPGVSVEQLIDWVAHWLQHGGRQLGKPTHFEARDGRF